MEDNGEQCKTIKKCGTKCGTGSTTLFLNDKYVAHNFFLKIVGKFN